MTVSPPHSTPDLHPHGSANLSTCRHQLVRDYLNLRCFNIRGLTSNLDYLTLLLRDPNTNFIAISEHWLHDYNTNLLHGISNEYIFKSVSPPQEEDHLYCVPRLIRGHGGVALGWHKSLNQFITPISFISSCRMLGIEYNPQSSSPHSKSLYILSVYLPCRSGCTDGFKESLDHLNAVILLLPPDADIIIMGDFNADMGHLGGPYSCTSPNEQGKIFHKYLTRWDFISIHLQFHSSLSTHIYESEAHSSYSTLDHIICPRRMLSRFRSAFVLEDHPLNTSDHLPVQAILDHPPLTPVTSTSPPLKSPSHPNWHAISKEDIHKLYTAPLKASLAGFSCELPSLSSLIQSPTLIDDHICSLTRILISHSGNIPSKSFVPHRSPGWNASLKLAHRHCKKMYRSWIAAGRPRCSDHPSRRAYKSAKRRFRSCLRLHRRSLADNMFASIDVQSTDVQQLFRHVRNMTTSQHKSHTQHLVVNNVEYGHNSLLEGWATHFEALSTPSESPLSHDQQQIMDSYLDIRSHHSDMPDPISEDEVATVIRSLPSRKAAGPDHLSNEHLKFGSHLLPGLLSTLFNAILFSHHIPAAFKLSHIIPIPKGHNKDLTNPSNYRGISLLSAVAKVFEKLLLIRLTDLGTIKLNPLQGGFRPGVSCLHSAFVFQEAIFFLREKKKKAFVAFLDVKKAFDTVWHAGLFVKLFQCNVPPYIWHILDVWYSCSISAVVWDSQVSRSFPIKQGVRQGSILSPLLYSIFVNALLDQLSTSSFGVSIEGVFCGAPMYADDLALIGTSEVDLQNMLDIVSSYALMWHYELNAQKSAILVLGESSVSRQRNRSRREWTVGGDVIPECDSQKHLGILHTVYSTSIHRTVERCSAGRSAFFALNAVGSRFGCLHPTTSLKIYIPIMLYGCEIWSLTRSEFVMLERVHRRILRTIQGLPLRCHSKALLHLMGFSSITSLIQQRQLNFVRSFASLPADSLPRLVLEKRFSGSPMKGSLPIFCTLLESLDLPSLPSIIEGSWSRKAWRRWVGNLCRSIEYSSFLDECSHLHLSDCMFPLGKPVPHWTVTRGLPNLTRINNFRIRLLVGCDGLEADASRFRARRLPGITPNDPVCKLCMGGIEDPAHFIAHCPALSQARELLLQELATDVATYYCSDREHFISIILGVEWIEDSDLQCSIIEFLHKLRLLRNQILIPD